MRPRRDIDDLDTFFDHDEAKRLRDDRADMVESGKERLRQEAARDVATKARVDAEAQENNRRMILREYEARGLAPRPGTLVSLALLLRMGWRIEEGPDHEAVLVAPPAPEKYVARGECT